MKIALFATLNRPHSLRIARQTAEYLLRHGHSVRLDPMRARAIECETCVVPEEELTAGADLVIAIGGDGTMLGAARLAAPHRVPVLGVNAGALGFLTEITPEELFVHLPRVLEGEFATEARMMLRANVLRGDHVVHDLTALNDVVVRQGAKGRIINLNVSVAGHQLGYFGADGLILSTPTGSTAYGLSAGGPIVHPTASVLLLVPICPHSLSFRPMVIPATDAIEILCESNSHGDEMLVTADGLEPTTVLAGDRVIIHAAKEMAFLVKLNLFSFYDRLREKLQWGGNR